MSSAHKSKFYIGGLISLVLLPSVLLLSTVDQRRKAAAHGEIPVTSFPEAEYVTYISEPVVEVRYSFVGRDGTERLRLLEEFCQGITAGSDTVYRVALPEGSTYGFLVQVIDLLRCSQFYCGIDSRDVVFASNPGLSYEATYESATWKEELQYLWSECSTTVQSLKNSLGLTRPVHTRILKYSDPGPPPSWTGGSSFLRHGITARTVFDIPRRPLKQEPRSAALIRSLGWWLVPMLSLWMILFVLSVNRSRAPMRGRATAAPGAP
jgi:hypothetical protein